MMTTRSTELRGVVVSMRCSETPFLN